MVWGSFKSLVWGPISCSYAPAFIFINVIRHYYILSSVFGNIGKPVGTVMHSSSMHSIGGSSRMAVLKDGGGGGGCAAIGCEDGFRSVGPKLSGQQTILFPVEIIILVWGQMENKLPN